MKSISLITGTFLLINIWSASAQDSAADLVQRQLVSENAVFANSQLIITDRYFTRHNGVEHLYMSQSVNGLRVINSNLSAVFSADGKLIKAFHNFKPGTASLSASAAPAITLEIAAQTILAAAAPDLTATVSTLQNGKLMLSLTGPGNYEHSSKAGLVYWLTPEGELILAWNFDIDMPSGKNWWQYIVSAADGSVLNRISWTTTCQYDHVHSNTCSTSSLPAFEEQLDEVTDGSGYRIFPFPVESPNHGSRVLLSEPAIALASPFGWHDNNGVPGPEFTITRGNNVYAYDDISDTNQPGFSPDGGASLSFDYPLDLAALPVTYTSASIANLFYANNRIHDYLYYFGFDEPSGNFQQNNYGNGGQGSDWVRAEAQDGGGTNNANMATPPDGERPRMQMYLWTSGTALTSLLTVNSPQSVAGPYPTSNTSAFGPSIPAEGITADMVIFLDGSGAYLGCNPAQDPAAISGKIAIIDRGQCSFVEKVLNAQNAGALGVVIMNNTSGVINPGGTSNDVVIPSFMISQANGNIIKSAVLEQGPVNATLSISADGGAFKDGSFDNGIVVHEYVHGLSNRLTGGPSQVGCLGNEEQMGEGWSDWYAIMMTVNIDVANPVYRPMGTFASSQSISGTGIRPAPYDTSFTVNSFTYANLPNGNISVPHGVGFVWSTMLWDLTWALIDEYGYDAEIDNPEAGNNIAMRLVTDALKLQVCEPGFVDGRDAILLADEINYGGANKCLIWKVFARRGLGFSASQGSSQSRTDGTAAFDLPLFCQIATSPPVALFQSSTEFSCTGLVSFTDLSTELPQSWLWDFGDGNTSLEQNPTHLYTQVGTYFVTLTVTNNIGEDVYALENPIVFDGLNTPDAEDAEACAGNVVQLFATNTEPGTAAWYTSSGSLIGIGNPFDYIMGNETTTLQVSSIIDDQPSIYVGPFNSSVGTGVNHNSSFTGTINFTTFQTVVIRSAWVNSSFIGERIIKLWDSGSGIGNVLQEIPVFVDFVGPGRIDLNITIATPGSYSIGLNFAGFFRNNSGVNYPYTSDLITLTGSSGGPQIYYYFYDIEVDVPFCQSQPNTMQVALLGDATFTYQENNLSVNFVSAASGAGSWQWNFGDGNTSIEQNPSHTYAASGTYTVTHNAANGCGFSQEVNVGLVGVGDLESSAFSMWPNPASNILHIVPSAKAYTNQAGVKIFNLSGKVVLQRTYNFTNEQWQIDLNSLASGLYMVTVSDYSGQLLYQDRVAVVK